MARTVGADKAVTHERIVQAAAKRIRRNGYANTSVADVMKDAGLTHGGFYAHFPSREAMLAEALDYAAAEGVRSLVGSASVDASTKHEDYLEALVDNYLSDRHLESKDLGCTIAALGTETRRQSPEIRAVATTRIKELIAAVGKATPDALATISTLVGALVIARIVDDPELKDDVRAAAKKAVLKKRR
ncbi:MAG: TetR/AcrR family transcriptional regulator [Kofleriaceae bacterium]